MINTPARQYDLIAFSDESTVVAEYTPDTKTADNHQSEAELEREFIETLVSQAYERVHITKEADLIENLRRQLEALNDYKFSGSEWERFFGNVIAGKNEGIEEKTAKIQENHVQLLQRDNGLTKNIKLLDKANIHNNRLQVINQYQIGTSGKNGSRGSRSTNRYDVTVLVNGLPLVHIELKRRGVDIREAFNQINRYQRDSFWGGSGIFEYVQLFVISNGTLTKYYSNTTREQHIKEAKNAAKRRKTSNSFEFTSWWADAQNKPILDLTAFAKTFFAKYTLLNILTKYCVLTAERMLLVMRPYQIVATERIMQRIEIATNYKHLGSVKAGGYVWHTTGSGKTLTSFKTAQLASALPSVDKVLFVVDRKDLDYQTMREYDRFQKGAANSNTSTAVLKKQLEDENAKIIITTIQKLSTFIKANEKHDVYGKHVVIIFDECHRSQFGDMHNRITKSFKRYNLFGFTGTPIFAANSRSGSSVGLKTTEQVFGDKLHTYTIVDAIADKNVLPFRIDYVKTSTVGGCLGSKISTAETEKLLLDERRIREVVSYTLEHFAQKTKRSTSYGHSVVTNVAEAARTRGSKEAKRASRQVRGFNAIFATASIEAARKYYNQFAIQQQDLPSDQQLKVGIIYSYGANEAADDGILDEEAFDTDALSTDAREFLAEAISDYNEMFGTSYDTSVEKFQNYYKDLSMRLKNRELDLVIVVNMFLTGFDATTLNTLFVDKNLRAHGLIQAYSRTNRILNSVKTYGNIVAFRDLEEETNAALELFGNKDASGIVLMKPFNDYYREYEGNVTELLEEFPLHKQIVGEQAKKRFIKLFGAILRLENILTSFDEFAGKELLNPRQSQDYRSIYLNLHDEIRGEKEAGNDPAHDDLVFEIELIKQVEINVDYILMLIEKHQQRHGNELQLDSGATLDEGGSLDEEINENIPASIRRAIEASPSLRNKKDLFSEFIDSITGNSTVEEEWQDYIRAKSESELADIVKVERLNPEETSRFMEKAFRDGALSTSGTAITKILPPVSRFTPTGGHGEKKQAVIKKLTAFFDRFYGLGTGAGGR